MRIIWCGLTLALFAFALAAEAAGGTALVTISGAKKVVQVKAEVAENDADREHGLMQRDRLEDGSGMLFIFDHERPVSMWMKDTKIPLDMIFIDGSGEVKKIHKQAKPYSLKIVSSEFPVLYTLEVPGGYADKSGIKEGDKMTYKMIQAR